MKLCFISIRETHSRTDNLIELAQKGEMISFTYRCLPSGYLNRKFKIEKDPLIVELEENRGRILLEYGGEAEAELFKQHNKKQKLDPDD